MISVGRIVAFLIAEAEILCQSYICHLSQPALSTPYCHFVPAWNRPVLRSLHLEITSSESLHPVLTTLRFSGAEDVELVASIHAQNASPHRPEMRDESAKSKGKPPNCTTFVPGLLTTLLSSRKHPGYRLRSPGQNSESVEAEEDTS